jgi:ABC-type uncharacterized transport system permease subunit
MLAGISLTCFAASYTVALLLEVTRVWFRSGVRGALMLTFAAAGLFAHTLFLTNRARETIGTPLSSEFDWYLLAAWALAAVYFVWTFGQLWSPNERRTPVGIFVLPLVLGLVAAAYFLGNREPLDRAPALRAWIIIHLGLLTGGLVSVFVGFAAGVMDLVQSSRLKRKILPGSGLRLPSLEWLERIGIRSIVASFIFSALGLLAGFLLNLVRGEFNWSDPVVWRLVGIVGWFAVASLFLLLYKPARQGRKVAYLAIASFVLVLVSISIGRVLPTKHGAPKKSARLTVPLHQDGDSPSFEWGSVRVTEWGSSGLSSHSITPLLRHSRTSSNAPRGAA